MAFAPPRHWSRLASTKPSNHSTQLLILRSHLCFFFFDQVKSLTHLPVFDLQVDSARRHGILLEAVQVLTDLNLSIKKAYISSDGRWFMDGKHLTLH